MFALSRFGKIEPAKVGKSGEIGDGEEENNKICVFLDKSTKNISAFSINRIKIQPREVKSLGYNTHKSLDVFCEKCAHIVERRYLIYTKDLKTDKGTFLLPVYMTPFLGR